MTSKGLGAMEQRSTDVVRAALPHRRRRADGVWLDDRTQGKLVWCIRYKGLDGRAHRERTQATTREEGKAILRRKLSEIARAQSLGLASVGALTPTGFRSFSKEFLLNSKATNTPSTYDRYSGCVDRLLSFFGGMALASITPGDVEKYIAQRRATQKHGADCKGSGCECRTLAPATVNQERAALSKTMNMALRRGLIDRNPVAAVRPLKADNARERYLEASEEERLVKAAPDWLRPMIVVALQTGMRLGEVLAIKRADVDQVRRMLRIPKTKSGKPRYVPLNEVAFTALDEIHEFVGKEGASPFVFVNPSEEKPYASKSLCHAFRRTAAAAGLATTGPEKVTFHTLRHTVVSRLVAAGVPDRKIMKLVGHSTQAMVTRYAHLSPDGLWDAAESLAQPPVSPWKRTTSVQTTTPKRGAV